MSDFDESNEISSGRTDIKDGKWEDNNIISSNSELKDSSNVDIKNVIRNNIKEVNKSKNNVSSTNVKPKINITREEQQFDLLSDDEIITSNQNQQKKISEQANSDDDTIFSQTQKSKRVGDQIKFSQEKQSDIQDNSSVLDEQNHLKTSLLWKFIVCLISTGFLSFFALAPLTNIPLPPFIDSTKQPLIFLACNLVFLLLTGFVGFKVAFVGIASVFKMRPDSDSITSLSFYASLLGNLYLMAMYFSNDASTVSVAAASVFSACASCAVTFNLFGKIFIVARVKHNLEYLENSGKDSFYTAMTLDEDEGKEVFRIFDGSPNVVTTKKVKYVSDYLDSAYSESMSDGASKYLSLTVVIMAFIALIASFLIKRDLSQSIILFTAVCAVSAPILLEFGTSLPFYKTCKRMTKEDTLITGCETVSEFCSTDAIVADSEFLFKKSGIAVHGVKPFSKMKIDDSIVYALSITKAGKSALYYALQNMFVDKESAAKVVRPVSKIRYEDERGLYAIIDNKAVLFGNRRLLRHYMVDAPTRDFEIRSAAENNDIVYLAIDGVLCAMFIVEYKFDQSSIDAFKKLPHYGVHILIDSTDPNVTPLLLEEKCSITSKNSLILGSKEMGILRKRKDGGINNAGLAFKSANGYIQGIISCIKLSSGMAANTWLQFIFSIVGALIVISASLFGAGISSIHAGYMFVYQLLTAVPIIIISLFRKN